jgi:hypothetical protein
MGLGLTSLIGCHVLVGRDEVARQNVRADERLNEAADLVPADDLMKACVDLLVDGDRELLLHTYRIRVTVVVVKGLTCRLTGERSESGSTWG